MVPAGPNVVNIKGSALPEGSEQTAGTDPSTLGVPAGQTATDSHDYQLPVSESPNVIPSELPSESHSTRANTSV